jgi:hypothetical protein
MDHSYGIWRLLVDPSVDLTVGSTAADIADSFIKSFRATWSCLAPAVQSALIDRWQSFEGGCPKFFLLHDIDLPDENPGIRTYGNYSSELGRFDFSPAGVRELPDRFLEALIAHELAHCFLGHTGGYSPRNEAETDALIASWGFPMEEFRAFLGL